MERKTRIRNRAGLHARAAVLLVQEAGRWTSQVIAARGREEVNAKSIMGVMMLGASCGTEILLRTDGPDEAEAMAALVALVEAGFGEDT